ncbi:hypothetical protein Rsub_03351 [Raphidocelis subcapitata]|uniref:Dolichyl-diphosphooligosaccharide--protein glycosyltransferase subunit 1 n=1 Tax=Raphidocelis subcapitata TaxID=307507 RepID=A0A2V0NRC2_9CHLO|nr:hypothetical protein Rsub_03351 [Raphidocelis subcapitata]|eukprot:GBF90218.1 hypothetical protein Rsub_03351 [Raphidocelis subcapitata]
MRRAVAVFALLALAAAVADAQPAKIKKAERKISLKSQVVKLNDVIEFVGVAGESSLLFCWPRRLAERAARIKVAVGKDDRFDAAPAAAPLGAPADAACFSAPVPIKKGEAKSVEVSASFTGVMKPNPAKVAQGEKQYVEYEDTLWLLSPYPIEAQSTTITLPDEATSFSPSEGASSTSSKVAWGKLGKAAAWESKPLKVHFHHDKPFKKVTKLVREIEVSHWGNIYVEESYEIINAGAEHKGAFSRLRHAQQGGAGNSFQMLRARLPPSAHSLYYRDLIGNISSSNTRRSAKETVVDLSLRYPLMGGWKTDFVLGYSLPLEGFLFGRPKGRSRLILDASSPIDDVVIEELETRVVLPEGAANIEFDSPFEVEAGWDKKFTYLDTAGRPVLVLRKSNLTPLHNKPFSVDYTFGTTALLREPLLLIGVFAALFAAAAVYSRCEFTISKDDRWQEARTREKAAATLQRLSELWDAEAEALARAAAAAESLTDAGGAEAAAARQAAEAELRALDAKAKPLIEALEAVSAKAAASARAHADAGKALQQRVLKLLGEKGEPAKKGAARALADARAEWAGATAALCD